LNTVCLNPAFSIEKAHKKQLLLSKQIIFEDKISKKVRYVAGIDVAYSKKFSIGAVAVLDYKNLKLVEAKTTLMETRFPYIPTLLAFRELPTVILCIKKLEIQPDIFIVDGHGFAHPYRCGFANHLGILIKKPTIGVAKNKLFGETKKDKQQDMIYLKHNKEIIGAVITKKKGKKPIYVSVGHMISLKTAIKIIKHCSRSRIPEPILTAHKIAAQRKKQLIF
jgi:deoxyribonuclease V